MKDHSGCVRGFFWLSRSWYGPAILSRDLEITDNLTIGFYSPRGGTTGEFSIKWERLCGATVPRLCAYSDAWSALVSFSDVLQKLTELDGKVVTPDVVVGILKSCGVEDMTRTKEKRK